MQFFVLVEGMFLRLVDRRIALLMGKFFFFCKALSLDLQMDGLRC